MRAASAKLMHVNSLAPLHVNFKAAMPNTSYEVRTMSLVHPHIETCVSSGHLVIFNMVGGASSFIFSATLAAAGAVQ